MRLKSHLVLLVLAAVLPLLAFAAIMLRQHVQFQRDAISRGLLDTARALSLAVDREVGTAHALLETLAASPYLDAADFKSFFELSVRAVAARPSGNRIVLFDTSGHQMLNTARPFGTPLPNPLRETTPATIDARYPDLPVGGPHSVKQALGGKFVVSDVFVSFSTQRPTIVVGMPVLRDGKVLYALEIAIDPTILTELLFEQNLPSEWSGVILDRNGIIVARSVAPEFYIGRPASAEILSKIAVSEQGSGSRLKRDEVPFYYAFARSNKTGWTTSVGVPQAILDRPLNRSLYMMAAGGAILLFLGLAVALTIGKRITAPISKLAMSADAIQRGDPIDLQISAVSEVRSLHEALSLAGSTAREAASERERRLVAEARQLEAEAAKQKIAQSENQLRDYARMLDLAPVVVCDIDDRIIYWNRGTESMYGWTKEEALGRVSQELLQTQFPESTSEINRLLFLEGEWKGELKQRTRDGKEIYVVSVWVLQRDEQKQPRATIRVSNDITERKWAEEALREADQRKDSFMAMLGHELRNPLGIISNCTQVLRGHGQADPQFTEVRDMIDRQLTHMARLVDDLLDVSRISSGRIQLRNESCDFASIVRDTVEDSRSIFEANGVRLELRLPQRPAWIVGDPTRLAQALANLLSNANKFTEPGGAVTVELECHADSNAVLTVRDTGIGIEPEVLAWVFEPFIQADRSLDRSRGGLGLGLALAKGIVELHGGKVEAWSAGPGHGSEFTIHLPLQQRVSAAEPKSAVNQGTPSPCRILLIEDNEMAARSAQLILEHMGHTCKAVQSGSQALKMAPVFSPDVVLCDIGLPEMDGYEVVNALRQQRGLEGTYFVGISGYGRDEQRAREAGFHAYLTKPVDFAQLEHALARAEVCSTNAHVTNPSLPHDVVQSGSPQNAGRDFFRSS